MCICRAQYRCRAGVVCGILLLFSKFGAFTTARIGSFGRSLGLGAATVLVLSLTNVEGRNLFTGIFTRSVDPSLQVIYGKQKAWSESIENMLGKHHTITCDDIISLVHYGVTGLLILSEDRMPC